MAALLTWCAIDAMMAALLTWAEASLDEGPGWQRFVAA